MNIIGNNCCGGYVYNMLNTEYENPFIWSVIFADDMLKLIENFDSINFDNYEMINLKKEITDKNKLGWWQPRIFGFLIDNTFSVYFIHVKYGTQIKPTKIGTDIFYNKNYEYVYEKYEKRLKRMLTNNEEPKFLVIAYDYNGWSKEKIEKLVSLNTQHKILLITEENVKTENPNIQIITTIELNKRGGKHYYPRQAVLGHKEEIIKKLEL